MLSNFVSTPNNQRSAERPCLFSWGWDVGVFSATHSVDICNKLYLMIGPLKLKLN